jgi:hypothetical protein
MPNCMSRRCAGARAQCGPQQCQAAQILANLSRRAAHGRSRYCRDGRRWASASRTIPRPWPHLVPVPRFESSCALPVIDWRGLLTVVKPATLIRWHRRGFSCSGAGSHGLVGDRACRPDLQRLIAAMAVANRTWGRRTDGVGTAVETWGSCVASDGEALHVPAYRASVWRAIADVEDSCAESRERRVGVRFLRDECLDWVSPLNEQHVRRVLAEWVAHYSHGRPHASVGPGIPIRTARRPASAHTIIACRSAFESSRSRCWAGCIMSTDWNPLREAGHGIGRRVFLRITVSAFTCRRAVSVARLGIRHRQAEM